MAEREAEKGGTDAGVMACGRDAMAGVALVILVFDFWPPTS